MDILYRSMQYACVHPIKNMAARSYTPEERADLKAQILDLLNTDKALNLGAAAKLIGVRPDAVYQWKRQDAVWASEVKDAYESVADRLENALLDPKYGSNPVPIIFLLKGLRPERYVESKIILAPSQGLQVLKDELKRLADKAEGEAKP